MPDIHIIPDGVPVIDGTEMVGIVAQADLALDPICQEIGARLDGLRPTAREASDLQRALDALNGLPTAAKRSPPTR